MVLPATLERHSPWLHTEDPAWLVRRWRKGMPPEIDRIFFLGSDIERAVDRHPWPSLLRNLFQPSFDNGFARIYSAVPSK